MAPIQTVVSAGEATSAGGEISGGTITVENPLHLRTNRYIEPLQISFSCRNINSDFAGSSPVHRDRISGRWEFDMTPFLRAQGEPLTEDEFRLFKSSFHFYDIESVNATGYAYTRDDVNAVDEDRRIRILEFFLLHDPVVLCTDGAPAAYMGLLQNIKRNPSNDLTPMALRMVRSIEFVPDSAFQHARH